MSRKTLGLILVVLGVLVIVVGAFADTLGIGEGGAFGWKQTVALIVGIIVAVAGGWLATRKAA